MPDRAPPAQDPHGRPFASPWDAAMATSGVPCIFTLDPRGELRVDPERTREGWLVVGDPGPPVPSDFVLTDAATGVRMYLFVTHPALAAMQPRGEVRAVTPAEGMAEARGQWEGDPPGTDDPP